MKPDERRLLDVLRRRAGDAYVTPRSAAAELGVSPKRCLLLCQGWWAKRWLERSPDAGRGDDFTTGRLTRAGMTAEFSGS